MPLSSRTRSSIGLSLVSISPGKFVMGNDKEYSGEAPAHRVEITRSFLMSATEVTQKQYEAVMGVNPSSFRGSDLPVETVSWNDAADFCRKLTELELKHGNLPKGYGYRLPTEAEWEYCCRAGSTTDYCFGDDEKLLGDYAWFGEAGYITHPVGTKMPNAWGLYDMHGNVCEWVWDWYSDYTVGTQVDPRGHLKGGWKVLRDEGLGADPRQYRSSGRAMAGPDNKGYWFGFRVVCAALTPEEILLAEVKSSIGISLVPVARDEFAMGSENGDPDEKETHTVEITRSFLMGSTEITQKQYADVMGANPSHVQGDDLPVDQVSWNEATEFCRKLTERERAAGLLPDGLEYRLPTEAEWEFCARAESGREYFFSTKEANNIYLLGDYAWFNGNAEGTCHPVGTRKPNAWGLYDMYGNVWEWCLDWYAEKYPYGAGTNPRGPEHGQDRVLRGGSWNDLPEDCRSAIRNRLRPDDTLDICGFRVVCACVR
ncbi:MAG: formylglycine-generating enzyme family protein [Candidatus Brocadiia bacterium]